MEIYTEDVLFEHNEVESDYLTSSSQVEPEIGSLKIESLESKPDIPIGVVLPSISAVGWTPTQTVDIRPRLVDSSTGQARLLDSGAQISATQRKPEDKIDQSMSVVAVNGSRIQTYGIRNLTVKIHRKTYHIPAVICDIAQDILGADFINKYRLGLEWDDFDQSELFITDKRAKISEKIDIVTVPPDIQRVSYLSAPQSQSLPESWSKVVHPHQPPSADSDELAFQVACIKKLGELSEIKTKKTQKRIF